VYFIATHVHHRFVGWPVFAFVLLNGAVLIGSILLAFKVGADAVGRLTQVQDLADRDPPPCPRQSDAISRPGWISPRGAHPEFCV
jgi:hypothetical protein